MGGATYQGAKSSRAVKELEALARAGILYSKKQNVSPVSLSDIGTLYGKPINRNIYNNANGLSIANEKMVTITTQIPGAVRPVTTLSVIVGANLSSSAVMSYGMADEVRHERKRYFGN